MTQTFLASRSSARVSLGLRLAGIVLGIVAVMVPAFLWYAGTAVRTEAASFSAETRIAQPVSFTTDERLFTLMAALNAAGYDDENNPQGMSPVRREVRAAISGRAPLSTFALKLLFRAHPSQYVAWVLQRGAPPNFDRASPNWDIDDVPDFFFFGLDRGLDGFYRDAGIAALWREVQPEYEKEMARYRPVASQSVQQVYAYLRLDPASEPRVVIMPNLLDSYWRGYGPEVDGVSYVVVGPSDVPNLALVQHEVLHPLVNSLVKDNLSVVAPEQAKKWQAAMAGRVSSGYADWDVLMQETAVRAIGARLLPAQERASFLAQQEAQGFLLVQPLATKLEEFEKGGGSFVEFIRPLLETLNTLDP